MKNMYLSYEVLNPVIVGDKIWSYGVLNPIIMGNGYGVLDPATVRKGWGGYRASSCIDL